jgi:hypothetical protein
MVLVDMMRSPLESGLCEGPALKQIDSTNESRESSSSKRRMMKGRRLIGEKIAAAIKRTMF